MVDEPIDAPPRTADVRTFGLARALVALVAVIALVAAGCGKSDDNGDDDSDDEKTDTNGDEVSDDVITFDDWVEAVNEICLSYENDQKAVDQAIDDAGDDTDELASALEDGIEVFRAQLDEVNDLGPPGSRADEVGDAVDARQRQLELIEDLVTALEDGDTAAVADLSDEIDAQREETTTQAEELGLDDCVSDDDEPASTTTTESPTSTTERTTTTQAGSTTTAGPSRPGGGTGTDNAVLRQEGIDEMVAEGFSLEQSECFVDYVLTNADPEILALIASDDPLADPNDLEELQRLMDSMLSLIEGATTACDLPPELLGL